MGGVLIAGAELPLAPNPLCVTRGGTYGCYPTTGAAVIAASPGDTIRVLPGFYREQVTIDRPLSLIGASAKSTIIDATNKDVGIYVDGMDNKGLREVLVQGFTVASAKFEGILVTNASAVTILENHVT